MSESSRGTNKLMTVKQVAELLNVKESTIYSWTYQRFIPHKKVGRLLRFDKKEVLSWVDCNSCKGRKGYTPDINLSNMV